MSFKRAGDDSSLLSNLQKKLVSDLIVSHIPNDEARLLSNGRYTCTVCSYKPVFDTLEVLAIHRKGKKHLQNLANYLEYRNKIISKSNNIKETRVNRNRLPSAKNDSLLTSSPYSSCCKKRIKPTDRKISLSFKYSDNQSSANSDNTISSPTVSTYLNSMKKKSSFLSEIENCKKTMNYIPKHTETIKSSKIMPPGPSVNYQIDKSERDKNKQTLELLRDGWILDSNGSWIKDCDAEFDSDEESPVIPVKLN